MQRDILNLYDCSEAHDWKSRGGCNAGCHKDCQCSVPVHECTRCGDCDYGQNEEADEVRRECRERNPVCEACGEFIDLLDGCRCTPDQNAETST